jgi:TonB family protein
MRIFGSIVAVMLAGATSAIAQDASRPLAKALQPVGRENWITDSDYPDLARRQALHGTLVYRLEIDADGKVTNCTILRSSSAPLLDRTTCKLLLKRARFIPGQDGDGKNIPATYTAPFVWTLKRGDTACLPFRARAATRLCLFFRQI